MTAVLYARLVEQGLASWDAPLHSLFSHMRFHESWRGTTVEHLMSHTGGLTDAGLLGAWELIKSELDQNTLPDQRLALATKAFAAPARGDRGKFVYSNANYVVLGSAIEQQMHIPWEAAIQQEVFRPLGIASAGFGAPNGEQPYGHRSFWMPGSRPKPVIPGRAADNPPFMAPAGGVHLSLEDYTKFLRVFLNGQNPFLSADTMKKLVTARSREPAYALGWLVDELPGAGGRALMHDGSNTMWYATAIVALEKGLAVVAVCNEGTATASSAVHRLARDLLEQVS